MNPRDGALQAQPGEAQVATRDQVAGARDRKVLDTPAICRRLGIHRNTWHRWVAQRQAPAPVPNLPGHPRWAVSDIERFERGRYAAGRVYFGAARQHNHARYGKAARTAAPRKDHSEGVREGGAR